MPARNAAKSKSTAKPKPKTKRKATPASWKKGQSGNPKGRPKDGESWAGIIRAVGDMYTDDILEIIGPTTDLGKALQQMPKNVQMKYLVTMRIYAALMFEPSGTLWNNLMDRVDGKVKEQIQMDGTLTVDNLEKAMEQVYGKRKNKSR